MGDANTIVTSQIEANTKKGPLVALESTVIAHGLPRPVNLEVAFRLERIIRSSGAIPVTIALLDGRLCVGLTDEELRFLANEEDIQKISIRDLPIAIAQKWNGATTVASSMLIAHGAGIRILATGGIGGVHPGHLPDVSADLPQLAQTPMVVVCSGAKSILNLPATREWLETYGVTVVGFRCDEFPAFYSRCSGLPVDVTVYSAAEVADLVLAQRSLKIQKSLLVTVPVPGEAEVPGDLLERILEKALGKAQQMGITGRRLTPFLLSEMEADSGGATLRANIALLENNVSIAATIARELY